jgi:hypothetical protein
MRWTVKIEMEMGIGWVVWMDDWMRYRSGLDLPERLASLSKNGELRVLAVLDGYRRRVCGLGKWVCCGLPWAGMWWAFGMRGSKGEEITSEGWERREGRDNYNELRSLVKEWADSLT